MPVMDVLTPQEASFIATNCYFTLKDWINNAPTAGTETMANIHNRVLGAGTAGKPNPQAVNPSLKSTSLAGGKLHAVVDGTTGMGTCTGFGYLLRVNKGHDRHAIIATRGTRPELGAPDLLTDARAAMTGFGDYGPVHKGFKKTFDSVLSNLARDNRVVMDADVVHCVGHSLGGGVATLLAAHFARQGKQVRLYTFGSPRVGAFMSYSAMHQTIGKQNIYRVAHDLDPVSLVGPFPYIHVNPAVADENNMTLPSRTGSLFSTANHDMAAYIDSVADKPRATWDMARSLARQTDHDNCVLAKWLLHDSGESGWVQFASAKTLGILFKLFSHVLKGISTSLILGLTAVDLLAEMLLNGMTKAALLGEQIFTLLRHAATWAGITVSKGAQFTTLIIGRILSTMLSRLNSMAMHAIHAGANHLVAMPLAIAGGFALAHSVAL
ncbi:lipase family protein [Massilia sp. R2A-15]|uniref:lipase family protein n=1 Tax=Massilia sp. R2A-15 TaxID=3064278 RepID=UPI002733197A|nr:lipase family protein [Massilia sp. R2A-15]WLI87427.1 lipase family protein [Massilia sp. R2A-15]